MKIIRVKDLIATLQMFHPEEQVVVSNDEELNSLYWGFEVAQLGDKKDKKVVLYPLSGQEMEELPFCHECFEDLTKNGDGEWESEEQEDGKILCYGCSAKKLENNNK